MSDTEKLNGFCNVGQHLYSPISPAKIRKGLSKKTENEDKKVKDDDSDKTSSSSESTIPPAPNGGYGWIIVLASFMIHFVNDGVGFAFGVIYVSFLDYFQDSRGKTAFVVSIYYAVPLLAGPIASILVDTYGCRKMTIVGGLISFVGFGASVFVRRIEALYVTMGLVTGLGLSLVNVASIVVVAFYFDSKRAFATGLSTSGSGIGACALGACTEILLQKYGWRGTTLLFSGLFLNIVVFGAMMRPVEWPRNLAQARRHRKYQEKLQDFQEMSKNNPGTMVALLTGDIMNLNESFDHLNANTKNDDSQTTSSNHEDHHELDDDVDRYKAHSVLDIPTYLTKNPILVNETYETLHKDYNVDNLIQLLPMVNPDIYHQTLIADPTHNRQVILKGNQSLSLTPRPKHDIWLEHVDKMRKAERYRFLRLNRSNITSRGCMLNTPKYTIRASSCPDVYTSTLKRDSDDTTIKQVLNELIDTIKSMCDLTMLKDITYLLFFLSNFLLCLVDDIPHLYIVDKAISYGIDPVSAGFILSIMGLVSTVGQIFFGYLADKPNLNTIYLYTAATAGCGLSCFAFTFFTDYVGLCAFAALYGFLISANYSLTSIILVDLMGLEEFTSSYGLILTAQGIGSLTGTPIGGWIRDITNSYDSTFYLAGTLILFSGLIMLIEPLFAKWKKNKRKRMINNKLEPIPIFPLKKDYKTNSLLAL
ncbi:unnamed protein product [Gordionus sp. m RMFG-2023]|uniref:monocarboxylate transporter 9-like n=1 Tax=Gordionus sp. m RMFG-2023 TaxID=3053472 RepID=UPI0030DEB98F